MISVPKAVRSGSKFEICLPCPACQSQTYIYPCLNMPWSDRDVNKSKLHELVIRRNVGQVVVILDHPGGPSGKNTWSVFLGLQVQKQNLSFFII